MLAFRIAGWSGCESQPSLLVRQIVLIALIDEFSMCLYFVVMNGFARSEEVVTESAFHVSHCIFIILCITLTKHAMFEIIQVLDVQEMLGNFVLPLLPCIIQDAKRHTSTLSLRLVHLITRE